MRILAVVSLGAVASYLQGCSSEKSGQFGNLKKRETGSTNTTKNSTDVETVEFDRLDYEPVSPLYLRQRRPEMDESYAQYGAPQYGGPAYGPPEGVGQRYPAPVGDREPALMPNYDSRFAEPSRPMNLQHELPTPQRELYPLSEQPERMAPIRERPAMHREVERPAVYQPTPQYEKPPASQIAPKEAHEPERTPESAKALEEDHKRIVNAAAKKAREEYARLHGPPRSQQAAAEPSYGQTASREAAYMPPMHQYQQQPPSQAISGGHERMYPSYDSYYGYY